MPLYEYVCSACHHEFEEMQKFSDAPIAVCPKCGKKKVSKKISLSGFQLAGGGWYKDGYSKSSSNEKSPAADKTKCDTKSGDGKKTSPGGSECKGACGAKPVAA